MGHPQTTSPFQNRTNYKGPFGWNKAAKGGGQYIDSSGRFVKRQAVRAYLDIFIAGQQGKMSRLAISHFEGKISIKKFQLEMMDELRSLHVASAALAKGGWAQLNKADRNRIEKILYNSSSYQPKTKGQFQWLKGLIKDMAETKITLPQVQSRLKNYFGQGRGTYHLFEREVMKTAGFNEEKRIRHNDDSCETVDQPLEYSGQSQSVANIGGRPGCVEQAELGWVPIGQLVKIGGCTCLGNCLCSFAYRKAETLELAGHLEGQEEQEAAQSQFRDFGDIRGAGTAGYAAAENWLADEFAEFWDNELDHQQRGTLKVYKGPGYQIINDVFRREAGEILPRSRIAISNAERRVESIEFIMDHAPGISEDIVVYRASGPGIFGHLEDQVPGIGTEALSLDFDHLVGSLVKDESIYSTSLSKSVATSFLGFNPGARQEFVFRIQVPKGQPALSIFVDGGVDTEEWEIILPDDTWIQIDSIVREGTYWLVEAHVYK